MRTTPVPPSGHRSSASLLADFIQRALAARCQAALCRAEAEDLGACPTATNLRRAARGHDLIAEHCDRQVAGAKKIPRATGAKPARRTP